MFSVEAITQAVSIWFGAVAVGLAFALVVALFSQRGQTAEAHGHDDHAHHDEAHHEEVHH